MLKHITDNRMWVQARSQGQSCLELTRWLPVTGFVWIIFHLHSLGVVTQTPIRRTLLRASRETYAGAKYPGGAAELCLYNSQILFRCWKYFSFKPPGTKIRTFQKKLFELSSCCLLWKFELCKQLATTYTLLTGAAETGPLTDWH